MSNTGERRGRGRRPADEVRRGILSAASRILIDEGIRAVTFERVAAEAGSSKMTLYKWWPSPGALAAEAYFAQSQPALAFPDTGDLRADLVTQLTSFVDLLTRQNRGRTVAELIGSAQSDPALRAAWTEQYGRPRRELARERLRAAVATGELPTTADIDVIIDQLWGAFYHRLLVLDAPFDRTLVEPLVDQALYGAIGRG